MSASREELDIFTREVLKVLENNLVFGKIVKFDWDANSVKPVPRRKLIWWAIQRYLINLRDAWLDAIKALAGIDPHRHCD